MRHVESTLCSYAAATVLAALPIIGCAEADPNSGDTAQALNEPASSGVVATPGAANPTPPAVNPTPPAVDPTPPAVDPTPPAVNPTPPAVNPTPPAVNPTPPAVNPTPPVGVVEPAAPVDAVNPGMTPEPEEMEPVVGMEEPAAPPGSVADGALLPQEGNPVHQRFDLYKDFAHQAENILSYQLDNGGWGKNQEYDSPGKGGGAKGTFDNGATTMEMTVMADAYKKTGEAKYQEAARKAMDFVLDAQYPEGGWPQFYPLKGGYADHVTFNDDAMSRTLTVLQHAIDQTPPLDGDVFTEEQRSRFQKAVDGGVDYILKAQYVQNGKKTVWCAQHGKSDYEPKKARSYEWPTLSGSESVEVIAFLMTQPQTPEIKEAVQAAVAWFASPDTIIQDYAYEGDKFIEREGSRVWARFYDLESNQPAFSNYDEPLYVGLDQWTKKKTGYRWGGTWGETIISYATSVGYAP